MVSRDNKVHVAAIVVALVALFALDALFGNHYLNPGSAALQTVAYVALSGVMLAGAHLFLAARGEGGLVPVDARWRFVVFVGAVLLLGSLSILFDPVSLGPVTTHNVLSAIGIAVVLAYLVYEAYDGYRDSVASLRST